MNETKTENENVTLKHCSSLFGNLTTGTVTASLHTTQNVSGPVL